MDSENDSSTIEPGRALDVADAPRARSPRTRTPTSRWQVGRLVKVSLEAACGFIRSANGELVYFAMDDLVAGPGELRAGSRVRYKAAGAGVPRALEVTSM